MGMMYGLGSDFDPDFLSPKIVLSVLDAAAASGFKVMMDMTFPGEKTSLFAPLIYKMHYFTKPGSGQT
jgi:hypothetical protein